MSADIPTEPVFFLKPDTALHKDSRWYYPDFTKDLHHEIEVVVKISKAGKHIAPEFAPKYYNEIGLGIDFTARDLQAKCKKGGLPWEIAKAFDHSAVLSNHFFPKESLDLKNLDFSLKINNIIKQSGNTSRMIFSVDSLISYVSRFITLKTGDLIYTGTPEGVGPVIKGNKVTGWIGDREMLSLEII